MTSAAQQEFNDLIRDKDRETRHPEDRRNDDSDRSDSDAAANSPTHEIIDTDDELDIPREMRSNYYLPAIRSEANTGPKGVIADAHAFEQAKKKARRFTLRKSSPPNTYNVGAYQDEKYSSDDSEDSFMQRWRQSRLRDLQNGIRSRTTSPKRGIYGTMITVDEFGFDEIVHKTPSDTTVLVFISDDTSPTSKEIENHMHTVAQRNGTNRFIKLDCVHAEIELAGVPAVLAYKAGELFAKLVPLIDEMPIESELSHISLETLFRSHRMLN